MTDGLIRRYEDTDSQGENHVRPKEKMDIYKPRRSPQNKINPADTLVFDFWLTEFWGNKFLFKPHSLWYLLQQPNIHAYTNCPPLYKHTWTYTYAHIPSLWTITLATLVLFQLLIFLHIKFIPMVGAFAYLLFCMYSFFLIFSWIISFYLSSLILDATSAKSFNIERNHPPYIIIYLCPLYVLLKNLFQI